MKKTKNPVINRVVDDKPIHLPIHEPIPVPAPIKPKLEVASTPMPEPIKEKLETASTSIPEPIKEKIAETVKSTFRVKVTHPSLRKRQAPSLSGAVLGLITDQGIYEIKDTANGWGQLTTGEWIMLQYTQNL